MRVIRTFRPDVLVARFSGTERDGHGNHQASSILAKEAFRAAADPKRFPEQIAQGLQPWQAKKFYIGNVCPLGIDDLPRRGLDLKFNTGEKIADLGMSYIQFAMEGLRHQMSQGAANWTVDPGDRFTFYRLVDSVIAFDSGQGWPREEFLRRDRYDLPGLAARLGARRRRFRSCEQQLTEIAKQIAEAADDAQGQRSFELQPRR